MFYKQGTKSVDVRNHDIGHNCMPYFCVSSGVYVVILLYYVSIQILFLPVTWVIYRPARETFLNIQAFKTWGGGTPVFT